MRLLLALPLLALAGHVKAVDVNRARVMDLDGVKGIGPALSRRILDERRQAPFRDWDDLLARVPGLGPASARKLSAEGLTVDGAPYPPPAAGK